MKKDNAHRLSLAVARTLIHEKIVGDQWIAVNLASWIEPTIRRHSKRKKRAQ